MEKGKVERIYVPQAEMSMWDAGLRVGKRDHLSKAQTVRLAMREFAERHADRPAADRWAAIAADEPTAA